MSLLIIEDNPGDVHLLLLALRHAHVDVNVRVIDDGGAAMRFCHDFAVETDGTAPQAIILDLNLPKYDGLEILQAIRSNPCLRAVPVALFSSSPLPPKGAWTASSLTTYLVKPAELGQYLEIGSRLKAIMQGDMMPPSAP